MADIAARRKGYGRLLPSYVAHADPALYKNKVVLYGGMTLFTDREAGNTLNPSQLDWIVGITVCWKNTELAFYRKEDRPLDQTGLVQKYYAVQLRFAFDVSKGALERMGLKR